MYYRALKELLINHDPNEPLELDHSTDEIDLDQVYQDRISEYFQSFGKEKDETQQTIQYVTFLIDSWFKETSSEEFLKENNLDVIILPEFNNAIEKHSKKIGLVENVKIILDEMRGHNYFKEISLLREKCLSDRYHWYSWALFSTGDEKWMVCQRKNRCNGEIVDIRHERKRFYKKLNKSKRNLSTINIHPFPSKLINANCVETIQSSTLIPNTHVESVTVTIYSRSI